MSYNYSERKKNYFDQNQHWFYKRKRRAVTKLVHLRVLSERGGGEDNNFSRVFIGLQKSFYCIHCELLFERLQDKGFRGVARGIILRTKSRLQRLRPWKGIC